MKGIFIAIEGIDGSGKTTLAVSLANWLFGLKRSVFLTREPYNDAAIRKKLSEEKPSGEELAKLFVEDRRAHIEAVIKPALLAGCDVVTDRFMYSTLTYQQAQGIPFESLYAMQAGFIRPDITIILDLAPEEALKRISGREGHEYFERLAMLKRVRKNYLELQQLLPKDNLLFLNAGKSKREVFEAAKKAVEELLSQEK